MEGGRLPASWHSGICPSSCSGESSHLVSWSHRASLHWVVDEVLTSKLVRSVFNLIILLGVVRVVLLDHGTSDVLTVDFAKTSNEVLSSHSAILGSVPGVTECWVEEKLNKASELLLAKATGLVDGNESLEQLLFHAGCMLEVVHESEVGERG